MKRYLQAFTYPLRGENGSVLLLGVAVLSVLPTLYHVLPVSLGLWDFGLGLIFVGYYALYLRSILHSSMEGHPHVPPWPDPEHPGDLLEEILSILAPVVVSFLPLILLFLAAWGLEGRMSLWMGIGSVTLLAWGWLYLPMAILVWTFYGGWSILNPVAVARTAWRTGPGYLLVSLLMAILVSAAWSVTLLPGGWLTTFGSSLLVFYALVVSMRMLGTHYNLHRRRLGWERVTTSDPH